MARKLNPVETEEFLSIVSSPEANRGTTNPGNAAIEAVINERGFRTLTWEAWPNVDAARRPEQQASKGGPVETR